MSSSSVPEPSGEIRDGSFFGIDTVSYGESLSNAVQVNSLTAGVIWGHLMTISQ